MFAFLFLLFPCALVAYCAKFYDRAVILTAVVGSVFSAIFCAIKFMFSFMHRVSPFNFFDNYIYVFLGQVLFPAAAVFAVFCLVSRDGAVFKSRMFFPLVASFYAIYLPFHIIVYNESAMSAYELFAKPVMFLSYIACMALCVVKITETIIAKKTYFAVAWCAIAICVLLVPAAIESAWIIGVQLWKWLVPFIAYVGVVSLLVVLYLTRREHASHE